MHVSHQVLIVASPAMYIFLSVLIAADPSIYISRQIQIAVYSMPLFGVHSLPAADRNRSAALPAPSVLTPDVTLNRLLQSLKINR